MDRGRPKTRPLIADLSDRLIEVLPQDVEGLASEQGDPARRPSVDEESIGGLFPGGGRSPPQLAIQIVIGLKQVINANAGP